MSLAVNDLPQISQGKKSLSTDPLCGWTWLPEAMQLLMLLMLLMLLLLLCG